MGTSDAPASATTEPSEIIGSDKVPTTDHAEREHEQRAHDHDGIGGPLRQAHGAGSKKSRTGVGRATRSRSRRC